jgi:hypothetical protein
MSYEDTYIQQHEDTYIAVYRSQERGGVDSSLSFAVGQRIYGSMTYEDTYIQQHKDTYIAVWLSYSGSVGSEMLVASTMRTHMQQHEDTYAAACLSSLLALSAAREARRSRKALLCSLN